MWVAEFKKCDEVMKIFAEEMAAVSHADTDTDFTEREREREIWYGGERRTTESNRRETQKGSRNICDFGYYYLCDSCFSLSLSLFSLCE